MGLRCTSDVLDEMEYAWWPDGLGRTAPTKDISPIVGWDECGIGLWTLIRRSHPDNDGQVSVRPFLVGKTRRIFSQSFVQHGPDGTNKCPAGWCERRAARRGRLNGGRSTRCPRG